MGTTDAFARSTSTSKVVGAACVPEQEPPESECGGGRVEFVVPEVAGHQVIAVS